MAETEIKDLQLARYAGLLSRVLHDAQAKAHVSEPELAALLSTLEPLPELMRDGLEADAELMDLLKAYEAKYLDGIPRYTRILREAPQDDLQLGFNL